MAGTLFVVATPIGHLEDITLRALRVLRTADLVAAEDTRRTGQLLSHFDIHTRLISVHEHNERARIPTLLAHLQAGKSIALVSDAGTPGASDPGMAAVRAARVGGIRVEAIPGPSAITAALSVAGYEFDRFVFAGFPPVRLKDRKIWFDWIARSREMVVFFEAPHRVRRTIGEVGSIFGEYPIMVARELTKKFEQVLEGPPADLIRALPDPRGEFTIVIPRPSGGQVVALPRGSIPLESHIGQSTESGGRSKRDTAREIARHLGLPVRDVYEALVKVGA